MMVSKQASKPYPPKDKCGHCLKPDNEQKVCNKHKPKAPCGSCIKHRTISEEPQIEHADKVLGSRDVPQFIMFDGEGHYQRKLLPDHQNLKVQVGFNFSSHEPHHVPLETSKSIESLPKIFNRRKYEPVQPLRNSITSELLQKYGKYSIRYSQKTDVLGQSKDSEYVETNDRYGKFYLDGAQKASYNVDNLENLTFNEPSYKFLFSAETTIRPPVQIKRFYRQATVEKGDSTHPMHQWLVKLDGKTVKTPSKYNLAVPSPQLASFVAHEFNMQGEFLRPSTMPLLSFSRTAVDMDHDDRIRVFMERSLLSYLERDTVLYREDEGTKLYKIQTEKLDPLLRSFNQTFGVNFQINFGLNVTPLVEKDHALFQKLLQQMNNWQLISLDQKSDNLKSTILALQLYYGHLEPEAAVKLSRLEEQFQIDQFGKVEGHHDVDENTILMNTTAAKLFSQLIVTQNINY